jgi:hypothetical protein
LWKVNVRTKENVAIYNPSDQCGYARRFQLDLSGTHMGAQGMPAHGCDGVNINGVCSFPLNSNGTLNNVVPFCGCNAAISPSGNYGANFCGSHAYLYINRVNYSSKSITSDQVMNTTQLTNWSGAQFGLDVEGVRWACNSDKWILQQCSPDHGQMATSDMVAGNFVDQAAIKMSNNVLASAGSTANGTFYFGNEPGDLWIDGGAVNKGKYEDETGAWNAVPGFDPSQAEYVAAGGTVSAERLQSPVVRQVTVSAGAAGAIRIDLVSSAHAEIRIVDMHGSTLFSSIARTNLTLPAETLKPGLYVMTERSDRTTVRTRIIVSR